MRILYLDIDSLRPDHLGCYGYHRDTSPRIDALAARGLRFDNCYATDVPCLPSRTALFAGRPGILNGVIDHGGVAAQPFIDGPQRGFRDRLAARGWMARLRHAGLRTATISPFGERHAAWHWYAGFAQVISPGRNGLERADQVTPLALDWLDHHGRDTHWFCHINLWDPHTPYRTPEAFGNPFADEPLPAWYTDDVRRDHWARPGPHSAQEVNGFDVNPESAQRWPMQPDQISDMEQARRMFDGYDRGVRYADHAVGQILDKLRQLGIDQETAVVVTADHGENLGELNIYGDHQTADQITTRVPLIVHWPGVTDARAGQTDAGLIHQYDFAATTIELVGGEVPDDWDGRAFTDDLRSGRDASGRDFLVVSQGAWSCQRGVRFNHDGHAFICIRSYHDGYHAFPDHMLFDLTDDPHEQHDLAEQRPELVRHAMGLLDQWHGEMMRRSEHGHDPMWTVMDAGGAFHTRGQLPKYLERLRATGRGRWAERLAAKHPRDLQPARGSA